MAGKNLFNSVKMVAPNKNWFDLRHDVKMSFNMGELVPVMCMPVVPGDKVRIGCQTLLRFAPLVAPVMHRMDVYVHYFFCPYRILWAGWEKYITNDADPLPAFPYVTIDGDVVDDAYIHYSALLDYLGFPVPDPNVVPDPTQDTNVSCMPMAVYQKIWSEYYRDQNMFPINNFEGQFLGDGDNTSGIGGYMKLQRRAWEHDYFTSCLPFAQKGAAVDIPLGNITLNEDWNLDGQRPVFEDALGNPQEGQILARQVGTGGDPDIAAFDDPTTAAPLAYNPDGSLVTEATTINDLRLAFRMQEWLEKNARGGSRYIENILAHFGVRSSDKRLQRPEYITGIKSPVVISEILNTTGTEELPQGNMSGHGVAVVNGKYGSYFCEEHGIIMGIMSVMPRTAYQQGIEREWLKINDPTEFYWPSFANIGEQAVITKELAAYKGALSEQTFGYNPRYSEYKFMNNRVAGDFRTTLDTWHFGRIFDLDDIGVPELNDEFIECRPTHRCFAVTAEADQKMYAHVLNDVRALRPMPKYGIPTF